MIGLLGAARPWYPVVDVTERSLWSGSVLSRRQAGRVSRHLECFARRLKWGRPGAVGVREGDPHQVVS